MERKLLTRDDHSYQRGCSHMLYILDRDQRPYYREECRHRPHRGISAYVQETLLNMVVREHEVVTLAFSGRINRSASETTQHFAILLQSSLAAALGRHPDDQNPLQPIVDGAPVLQQLKEFAKGVKSVNMDLAGLDQASNVVDFVLDQFRACRQSGSKEYPFSQHMSFFLHLLRECHYATDEAQLHTAAKRLKNYIFLTSYGKMNQRLNLGKGQRKIHKNLVECVATDTNIGYDLPVSSAFLEPPNPRQAKLIRASMKALRNHGLTNEMLEKFLESPLYDANGRERFHYMLQCRVIRVDKALENLKTVMVDFKRAKDDASEPDRAQIAECVAKAGAAIHKLEQFMRIFQDIMVPHLTWIAHVAGIDRRSFPTPRRPAYPHSASIMATTAELDPDNVALDHAELSTKSPTKSFAAVAHKYLELICMHESCLRNATRFSPARKRTFEQRISALVLNAQVSIVETRYQAPETSRASIRECLIRLQQRDPQLNMEVLEGWFSAVLSREKDSLTRTHGFDGVVHCGSKLMSFMAAIRDKDLLRHIVEEGNSTVEKSLLVLFARWRPVIHVSELRECCPPCWKLREVMETHFKTHAVTARPAQMCEPGNHGDWTSFALPAWSPKNVGEGVLKFHEDEILKKLVKLQHNVEQQAILNRSESFYADEDDSDVEVYPVLERSEGVLRVTAPSRCNAASKSGVSPQLTQHASPLSGSAGSSNPSPGNTPTPFTDSQQAPDIPYRSRRPVSPSPGPSTQFDSSSGKYLEVPAATSSPTRPKRSRADNDTWDAELEKPDTSPQPGCVKEKVTRELKCEGS